MGFLTRIAVPRSARKPLRAARAVKNPVGYARRQVTPKPVKKALKVAHPIGTIETAAADAVNRTGSKKSTKTKGAAHTQEEPATRVSIAVSENDLPAPIDEEVFMAWERHRVRLNDALGQSREPVPRYRDLILITNVMARQWDIVEEAISQVRELTAQGKATGNAAIVEVAQAFTTWVGPWIKAFDDVFQQLKTERDALGNGIPSEQRKSIEDETGRLFDAIKQDPMDVLRRRLDELKQRGDG